MSAVVGRDTNTNTYINTDRMLDRSVQIEIAIEIERDRETETKKTCSISHSYNEIQSYLTKKKKGETYLAVAAKS